MARQASMLFALVLLVGLLPATAQAQFDARNPDDVGLAILPFESRSESDKSVAFLLEDYLNARLSKETGHPVYTGRDVEPALASGIDNCLSDPTCVQLLGGQFNVSLVNRVLLSRSGPDIMLEVDWYATGNGLRIGRENTSFRTGEEDQMVRAFAGWWKLYFDTSLRVTPEGRAGEGGILDTDGDDQDKRVEEYRSTKKKKVSSRRSDFGSSDDEDRFDRSDPTSDLRRAVEGDDDDDDDDERSRRSDGRRGRDTDRSSRDADRDLELGDDDDDDDAEDEAEVDDSDLAPSRYDETSSRGRSSKSGATKKKKAQPREERSAEPGPVGGDRDDDGAFEDEDDDIDLDATDTGASVSSYSSAQRAGYGKREYSRFTRLGVDLDTYATEKRWALGGRFHLRIGGYYGAGYLTRRYASVVFVRIGGTKTDEYLWERLGSSVVAPTACTDIDGTRTLPGSPGNPGGGIGFGYAPIDLLSIEGGVSVMYAKQDLRREWVGHELGRNVPQCPQSQPTAHIVADLRARIYVNPKQRVKFGAGLGITTVIMQGYNIPPTPDEERVGLTYTDRPVAGVLGITPVVGATIALSPFVSIYVDALPTIFLTRGAAHAEETLYFNGVTAETSYLPAQDKQPPLSSVPFMVRVGAGTMLVF